MTKSFQDNMLDNVSKLIGDNSKLGKLINGYRRIKEANDISRHFSTYFSPKLANTADMKNCAYRIRHTVYCEELHFEKTNQQRYEHDAFDSYSQHCLVYHHASQEYAGTVRVVKPCDEHEQLPIEKYCLDSITDTKLNPSKFPREHISEVSRLAVPAMFRRRQTDQHEGAAIGVINQSTYSETELRCFPFIAIGLYLCAASHILECGIPHTFVMMEPRLARSMSFIGIEFKQLGPAVEYHGLRAPYYINPELLFEGLSPGFQIMMKHIQQSMLEDATSAYV